MSTGAMREISHYRAVLCSLVLSCALTIPWLGRPFHTRGEPREALVAQAMLETGNWISPPAYDGAVPSKPPFSHWLISVASLPLGQVTEASARLPSAIAFVLFSAALCVFVARRVSPRIALSVVIVLLASFEWFRAASTCRVDTILATSMAGAMLALFAWWERGYRGVPWLAFILISVSALTKGPVGIVLPVGIFSLFCWLQSGNRLRAIGPIALRGTMLALAAGVIVSTWYVLGYLERGEEFIAKIRYENIERFTSSMQDEPHKHSVWYLLGMLFIGLIPWSCFWLSARTHALKVSKRECLNRVAIAGWYRNLPDLYKFSLVASLSVVTFFCIPSSKRSVYLLPAFPFFALLLERSLREWLELRPRLTRYVTQVLVSLSLVTVIATFVLMVTPVMGVVLTFAAFTTSMSALKVVSVCLLVVACFWGLSREYRQIWDGAQNRIGLTVICAVVLISFFSYDTVASQLSVREWVKSPEFTAAVRPESHQRMYSFGTEAYGVSFYLRKPFFRLPNTPEPGSIVFLERRKLPELATLAQSQLVELAHYSSGLAKPGRDIVVVEVSK